MISEIELGAIIPKHLTNRCCQTHTTDRRQSQSHNNALIAIWTVSSEETSGTEVQARCACQQQQRVDADRWNFSAKSHPVRPRFMRTGVCPHIDLRAKGATKKSEATTQIVASHSDTFGVHDTPVLAPCANTTSDEMFVHPVTHASAPFSLALSPDPWKRNVAPSHERKVQF